MNISTLKKIIKVDKLTSYVSRLFIFTLIYVTVLDAQINLHTRINSPPSKDPRIAHRYDQLFPNNSFSGSSEFTVLGGWKWGPNFAVASRDSFVFIGNGPSFQILSITDTSYPKIIGEIDLGSPDLNTIIIRGSFAYVGSFKLYVLDIRDVRSPKIIAQLPIGDMITQMVIADSFLYVGTFSGVFRVIDISNPMQPALRGGTSFNGERPSALAVRGKYVYGNSIEFTEISIFDVSDPDFPIRSHFKYGAFDGAAMVDTLLLITGWDEDHLNIGLHLYDVSNPLFPIWRGVLPIDFKNSFSRVTVQDSMAFVAFADSILSVNIASPFAPVLMGQTNHIQMNTDVSGITSITNQVFVASYLGLWGSRILESGALKSSWFFPTSDEATSIFLKDSIAFVTCAYAGTWALNVSKPESVKSIVNFNPGGRASAIKVKDSLAFIVNSSTWYDDTNHGLWIYDITDIQHPQLLSHYIGLSRFPGLVESNKIEIQGNYLYVTYPNALTDSTIEIIDVRDPMKPSHAGLINVSYGPYDMIIKDSLLFASSNSALTIFSISNPIEPRLLSNNLFVHPHGLSVNGSILYVSASPALIIMNISDPVSPSIISFTDSSDYAKSLSYSDNYVYASGNVNEIFHAIDVHDPFHPIVIWPSNIAEGFDDVVADHNRIFVTRGYSGISILKNNLITSIKENAPLNIMLTFELFQNYPNPFNSETTISFYSSKSQYIQVGIFNILGQEMGRLFDYYVHIGQNNMNFNANGLPSGVYIYRVKTSSGVFARSMIVVK